MDDKKQSQNTPITIDTFIPVLQRFSQLIDGYRDLSKQHPTFEELGDYLAKLEQIKFDLIKSSIAIYSIACTLKLTKPQKILNLPKDLNPVDGIERTPVQLAIHRNAVFAEANYECMGLLLEANVMKSDSQAVQNASGKHLKMVEDTITIWGLIINWKACWNNFKNRPLSLKIIVIILVLIAILAFFIFKKTSLNIGVSNSGNHISTVSNSSGNSSPAITTTGPNSSVIVNYSK